MCYMFQSMKISSSLKVLSGVCECTVSNIKSTYLQKLKSEKNSANIVALPNAFLGQPLLQHSQRLHLAVSVFVDSLKNTNFNGRQN